MTNTIKFFYNGIKINGGKLQACLYSKGNFTESSGIPMESITIYKQSKKSDLTSRFSKEVGEFFTIKNDTDLMTDCFDSDSILVCPDHPLYSEVLEAFEDKAHKNKLKAEQRHKKHIAALVEACKAGLSSLHYKLATASNPIDIEILEKRIQETNKIILENS
jgi:hypothetical protein